jgi:hypothetical protein
MSRTTSLNSVYVDEVGALLRFDLEENTGYGDALSAAEPAYEPLRTGTPAAPFIDGTTHPVDTPLLEDSTPLRHCRMYTQTDAEGSEARKREAQVLVKTLGSQVNQRALQLSTSRNMVDVSCTTPVVVAEVWQVIAMNQRRARGECVPPLFAQ